MSDRFCEVDVAVIGAGLAGLVCAKQLQQQGLRVLILEKSKGVGGRVATRRLHQTCADHGLPYFTVSGKYTQTLKNFLDHHSLLTLWTDQRYQLDSSFQLHPLPTQNCFSVAQGITAIAKVLATDLEIWRECRITKLIPTAEQVWHLQGETGDSLTAKAIVTAIPAPQATMLLNASPLKDFPDEFFSQLSSVEYDPSIVVMAGYSSDYQPEITSLPWRSLTIITDPQLAWIGLDSSKRDTPQQPVFVLHSTSQFAQDYLDTPDLNPIGEQLLQQAGKLLFPWLNQPEWFQVHRWRYAFPRNGLPVSHLCAANTLPLVSCGDWCKGEEKDNLIHPIETALNSGFTAATAIFEQIG